MAHLPFFLYRSIPAHTSKIFRFVIETNSKLHQILIRFALGQESKLRVNSIKIEGDQSFNVLQFARSHDIPDDPIASEASEKYFTGDDLTVPLLLPMDVYKGDFIDIEFENVDTVNALNASVFIDFERD